MKALTPLRVRLSALILLGLGLFSSEKCDNSNNPNGPVIGIPVCGCIISGAAWTRRGSSFTTAENNTITNNVNSVIDSAGKSVWLPGAGIGIVPQIDRNGNVPVISFTTIGGAAGDVQDTDGDAVSGLCRAAWGDALVQGGLVVIFAHHIISSGGVQSGESGFAPDANAVYQRNGGQDICAFPRHITRDDMTNKWIVVEDPVLLGLKGEKGNGIPFVVLAHELGHIFLLQHGDGLDNDHNGLLPPNAGPRMFDLGCDVKEYQAFDAQNQTVSLMIDHPGYPKNITPLQVECARAAAGVIPGSGGRR